MKLRSLPILALVSLAPAASGACAAGADDSAGSAQPPPAGDSGTHDAGADHRWVPPADGGGGDDSATEAGDDGSGDGAADAGSASLRVAHFSPDMPPVDFCLLPSQGTPVGPVLAANGLSPGIPYGDVTQYLTFAPGSWKLRLVAPHSPDCSTSIGPLDLALQLADATFGTVVVLGEKNPAPGAAALELVLLSDETQPSGGQTTVRFLAAMPDVASMDVGKGALETNDFTALATAIKFGQPPAQGGFVDANGYAKVSSFLVQNVTLSAHATGAGADLVVAKGVTLKGGTVLSAFAIGAASTHPKIPQVVVCDDLAAPQQPPLATCQVL